jgi:hypothetical protein
MEALPRQGRSPPVWCSSPSSKCCCARPHSAPSKPRGNASALAPDFGFPRRDARLDFTDLYAFPKPEDPRKSILVMNVHPSAVVDPPGPTTAEPFAPEALYELKIDTDGDAIADIAYRVRFLASEGGCADRDAATRCGRAGRWDGRQRPGDHRSSTRVDGAGGTSNGGWRPPLLRELAQEPT